MIRSSAVLLFLLVGGLFANRSVTHAQDGELPTAEADEIVFLGEVPAPPGTEVRIEYLFNELVQCGTAVADESSRFVLRIEATCAQGGTGPLICWAPGLDACEGFPFSPIPGQDRPVGGDTIDLGRLSASDDVEPNAPPDDAIGAMPATGGVGLAQDSLSPRSPWPLRLGFALLAASLVAALLAWRHGHKDRA